MYIDNLILENIKSFKGHNQLNFCKGINTIVGVNNSGKSTIIKSLLMLQYGTKFLGSTILTVGEQTGNIRIGIKDVDQNIYPKLYNSDIDNGIYFSWNNNSPQDAFALKTKDSTSSGNVKQIGETEPENFIYPHLSTRDKPRFEKAVTLQTSNQVNLELHNIYPKIDRIINSKNASLFHEECENILGIDIGTRLINAGRDAGLVIDDDSMIPVEDMGDGLPKLIGFILDLCIAENKLFIIEEPENDIHPGALKSLLDLIIRKSVNNQFIITTHSNIVTKYLGSHNESKLFRLSHDNSTLPPISIAQEIGREDLVLRKEILYELGYEMLDFDLWEGFILFEESSAERIIRDILIPIFNIKLVNKMCTIASNGIDDVNRRFYNLHQTMVYLHRTPIYQKNTWVIVDNHPKSEKYRKELINNFNSWNEDQFYILSENDFEKYYPKEFQKEVERILKISDKQEKRSQKKILCDKVVEWAGNTQNKDVKEQFLKSAKEVIEILKDIESKIV